ncbi:YbhB/YbcL family Raf kinase inhibitor-like protein [Streptomyces sp. NBC_00448]|uniref:YbhB/YbcL family Raf kinase inhibitor-like protein n=1 Tax=Streptomyces sp. NBC_00448 TaxID=2903652 RepID=UPI002E23CC31
MRTSVRAGLALAAVAAITAGWTGAASAHTTTRTAAHTTAGRFDDHGFGYTTVRSGIPDAAARFTVTSPDVRDGGTFPADAYADAFGCTSANQQVRLAWHGAPKGTRSYAVTMFDPDAPSGTGFLHWLTWDIPAQDSALGSDLPAGAVAGTDSAGVAGWLGPCPPAGDLPHHYQITVYALDVPTLALPAATPAAVTTFTMSTHILGYARLTALASR